MHTFQNNGVVFRYDADVPFGRVLICKFTDSERVNEIDVNGEALLEFVAQYIRAEKISKIEQASWREVLGLENTEERE